MLCGLWFLVWSMRGIVSQSSFHVDPKLLFETFIWLQCDLLLFFRFMCSYKVYICNPDHVYQWMKASRSPVVVHVCWFFLSFVLWIVVSFLTSNEQCQYLSNYFFILSLIWIATFIVTKEDEKSSVSRKQETENVIDTRKQ